MVDLEKSEPKRSKKEAKKKKTAEKKKINWCVHSYKKNTHTHTFMTLRRGTKKSAHSLGRRDTSCSPSEAPLPLASRVATAATKGGSNGSPLAGSS